MGVVTTPKVCQPLHVVRLSILLTLLVVAFTQLHHFRTPSHLCRVPYHRSAHYKFCARTRSRLLQHDCHLSRD